MKTDPIFLPAAQYPSSHAATIVQAPDRHIVAAWFGGTHEGHPDVAIWLSHLNGEKWSPPIMVANETDTPLWNPVLFCDARKVLWLFYKIGPNVPSWTGAYIQSIDNGYTWSSPVYLPAGLLGPIKNKPVTLSNGEICCGTSHETWQSWASWVEMSGDFGQTWKKSGPITAPSQFSSNSTEQIVSATWDTASGKLLLPQGFPGVIQPTLWECEPGHIRMLMRATRRVGYVCLVDSFDFGRTWQPVQTTPVPNPNSGLDAVLMNDKRIALICNPSVKERSPLSLLISSDNGLSWPNRIDLETEPGEFSYPSIIQAVDGKLHIVTTYQRQYIRHYVLEV